MRDILTDFFKWCIYRRTKIGEKTADFILENGDEINLYVDKNNKCFFEFYQYDKKVDAPEYVYKQLKIFCKEKEYKF